MPVASAENIEAVIASMFDAFRDVPKPQVLVYCDCGSCFSSTDANTLYSQPQRHMDLRLLCKCFDHFSVTQDKDGLRYLLPAFTKAVLDSTISNAHSLEFYTWSFGRLLQQIGIENWPINQQDAVWNWFELELELLLTTGNLHDFDELVTSLIRPSFEWTRFTSLLKEARHHKAKLGHIAFFLPWENGYESAPKGFQLMYSNADNLSSKQKEAYHDWMIMNLSSPAKT